MYVNYKEINVRTEIVRAEAVRSKRSMRLQSGMSLVEILVVLAIIGGVMALIAPNVFGNKEKANQRTAKIIMAKLSSSINEYYNDCNQMPDSLNDLVTSPGDDACDSWGPQPYAKEKEILDPWGNDLVYEQTSNGFTLVSLGKDGAPGGEGFDSDIEGD